MEVMICLRRAICSGVAADAAGLAGVYDQRG